MKCEYKNCQKEHLGTFGSGRFCSYSCSRAFSTFAKRKEINKKVSNALTGIPLSFETKEKIRNALTGKKRGRCQKKLIESSELFKTNCKYTRQTVKRRILEDKIFAYKCVECGNEGQHNNKVLTLELDHINGNKKDNRLENLRFLCPNCHTQTPTYGFKKRNMPL